MFLAVNGFLGFKRPRLRADVNTEQYAHKVGGPAGVWDGKADSLYAGPSADIAIAGGLWDLPMAPFRIRPDEVHIVEVGSNETKSRPRAGKVQMNVARSFDLHERQHVYHSAI